MIHLADPFRHIDLAWLFWDLFMYNGNLWTIPIEFRGSIVVFGLLIALARFPSLVRILLMQTLASYALYYAHWDLFLFISGAIFAEFHFARESWMKTRASNPLSQCNISSPISLRRFRKYIPYAITGFWLANFLGATYILSMPHVPEEGESYGFQVLRTYIPLVYQDGSFAGRFWPAIGAVYLIFVLENCKLLHFIYTNSIAQYLGRISFSLYLVHGTVLHTTGVSKFLLHWLLPTFPSSDNADDDSCLVDLWNIYYYSDWRVWNWYDHPDVGDHIFGRLDCRCGNKTGG